MAHIRPDLGNLLTHLGVVEARPDASPVEIACVDGVPAIDTAAAYDFVRRFIHEDWIDGESLVQAAKTPEESGFNERFHNIERDLDSLGDNVNRAFQGLSALRAQLRVCLNEIVVALNQANKNAAKDTKDGKDTPDAKQQKDNKESKDHKDTPDGKHTKDQKDTKEDKEAKEVDDKSKEHSKEGLGAAEKKDSDHHQPLAPVPTTGRPGGEPIVSASEQVRVFIQPSERPVLGTRALGEPRTE